MDGERRPPRDRGGLADRVGPADRRPGADRRRRRPRRGPRPGRARRGARAVAGVGRPGQPGRLADGHRQEPRRSTACAAARCRPASRRSWAATSSCRRGWQSADLAAALDDDVGDDLLRLIFTACHPLLSTEARVALTLRLLGGLTTAEIARAFLAKEATVAQRIVRAKRTLAEARVPFEVPRGGRARAAAGLGAGGDLPDLQRGLRGERRRGLDPRPTSARKRCGWAASSPSWRRRSRRRTGLVALMELQASRFPRADGRHGRGDPAARAGPLALGPVLIVRGLAALERAEALGRPLGPYGCRRRSPPATRGRATPRKPTGSGSPRSTRPRRRSPARRSSSSTAPSRWAWRSGPAAGLELVDGLAGEPALAGYHLLPAARGDLLERLGRGEEAGAEFARAAALTGNARERELLQACAPRAGGSSRLTPSA